MVGDATLDAGDFLLTINKKKDVYRWVPDDVGAGSSGAQSILIEGIDIGIEKDITGVELVEVGWEGQ